MPEGHELQERIASDIAVWLRVHADAEWTEGHEAVQLLARRVRHLCESPLTDESSDIIRRLMREVASSPVSYSPDNPGVVVVILDINVWNAISAISSMSPPAESEDG